MIGNVRACGSSTLPDAGQTARWHSALVARRFDLRGRYQSSSRCFRFRDLSDDVYLRRVYDAEQNRAGSHVGAGRGVALGNHAADGSPEDEQSFGVRRAAHARHVVLRKAGLSRGEPRLRLFLCGTRFIESLFRRSSCARQPLGTLTIARREGERGVRVSSRSLQLRQIARQRGRREQPRKLLPA